MTPDLLSRVREAFEGEYYRLFDASDGTYAAHDEACESALAAVIAVVQEDRTREVTTFLLELDSQSAWNDWSPGMVADAITREFGGTTHE